MTLKKFLYKTKVEREKNKKHKLNMLLVLLFGGWTMAGFFSAANFSARAVVWSAEKGACAIVIL